MSRPQAGSIVVVDWRGGSLPSEPNKLRPAVVVEDADLFPENYPLTLVVPLTSEETAAYPSFTERIEPTLQNGATASCWALAHHIAAVSRRRVRETPSRISDQQLASIRERIALALGIATAS